jgi:hypothetical protein
MEIDQEDAGKSAPGEDRCAPFLSIQADRRNQCSGKLVFTAVSEFALKLPAVPLTHKGYLHPSLLIKKYLTSDELKE